MNHRTLYLPFILQLESCNRSALQSWFGNVLALVLRISTFQLTSSNRHKDRLPGSAEFLFGFHELKVTTPRYFLHFIKWSGVMKNKEELFPVPKGQRKPSCCRLIEPTAPYKSHCRRDNDRNASQLVFLSSMPGDPSRYGVIAKIILEVDVVLRGVFV